MNDMNTPARNKYRIKVVSRQIAPAPSPWKDVMSTEMVSTRTNVVDIAALLQRIYPKPEYLVQVHLVANSGQPVQIAWDSHEEPGDGAA